MGWGRRGQAGEGATGRLYSSVAGEFWCIPTLCGQAGKRRRPRLGPCMDARDAAHEPVAQARLGLARASGSPHRLADGAGCDGGEKFPGLALFFFFCLVPSPLAVGCVAVQFPRPACACLSAFVPACHCPRRLSPDWPLAVHLDCNAPGTVSAVAVATTPRRPHQRRKNSAAKDPRKSGLNQSNRQPVAASELPHWA